MRVDFYHLEQSTVERALPPLLERVIQAGYRAVVLASSPNKVEVFADVLWTYNPNTWLPHGTEKDGRPADQPIWLTDCDENPNQAKVLVLTDGMISEKMPSFERCLDLFDGNNSEDIIAARKRWSAANTAVHELQYWHQMPAASQEKVD